VPHVRLSVRGPKMIFFDCSQLGSSAAPNGFSLIGTRICKAAAAAMAATLLLGAAEECHSDSPVELLSLMNRVLCSAHLGGFATCLCVDLAPDGELTLANAGHLSPYRGGNEMETAGGLPPGHHARR
jgi:hypothetical protein